MIPTRDSFRFPLNPPEQMVVGGTILVDEFFGSLSEGRGPCQLMIASAFMNEAAIERFSGLNHRLISLQLVVRSAASVSVAEGIAAGFPWRLAAVRRSPLLHAKLFVVLRDDMSGAFMIGSHNLTRAGTGTNLETGVLYRSLRLQSCADPVLAAAEQFRTLWRKSISSNSNP